MSIRITLEQLDALRSPYGAALLAEIADNDPTPADALPLITGLRTRFDADLVSAAMTIHSLRQRARTRFQDADRLWLTGDGLEQASGDLVADHRAARFGGCTHLADLCCGIGGDLMALARRLDTEHLIAVDRDPIHAAMAELNARIADPRVNLDVRVADAQYVDLDGMDAVFLDPARRSGGRRVGTGQTSPPLDWAIGLTDRVRKVGITVAPGLDHERIPAGWEFEAVAVGTDLKEGMLWSPALATATRRATIIDPRGTETNTLSAEPDRDGMVSIIAPQPGMTVIDPNPAITRAGLVQELARQLDASMIDPQIAFLVTPGPIDTPFGRVMTIIESVPWHEKRLKARLRELGAGPVDLRRRGLAGDVDRIAKRLRGIGERAYTVLMTRHNDAPWAIIAEDTEQLPGGRVSAE